MKMEHETLLVRWHESPLPDHICYKPTGMVVEGMRPGGMIVLDGTRYPLADCMISWRGETCCLTAPGERILQFTFRLERAALCISVKPAPESEAISRISFSEMPALHFSPGFRFARDRFRQRSWSRDGGPGLLDCTLQVGVPLEEVPDLSAEDAVHACAFDGRTCVWLQSSELYLPLSTRILPHPDYPNRGGELTLGFHHATLAIDGCTIPPLELAYRFCEDMNHDGLADENEYQLDLKQRLPGAHPLYLEGMWYKIWLGRHGRIDTDYEQVLELIRRIDCMTGGARQVVYLVGYQGEGHDSDYPTLHRLNPRLGTREALLNLISVARERYGAIVSVHTNVDDAYRDHIGWDPSIVSSHPDGTLMRWEGSSFHINHRRDVLLGKVFQRLDDLLSVVPIQESIHLDAFRNTNSSWGEDGYIGPEEELYGGIIPILDYFKRHDIDVTTESQNGMGVEIAGLFTGIYHAVGFWPVLMHGRIIGGGQGGHPVALVKGSGIDDDLSSRHLDSDAEEMLDWIAERTLLYRYFLQREMVEYRGALEAYHGRKAYARYHDGTIARGQRQPPVLDVRNGDVLIADLDTRFIPLGKQIFVWHRQGGIIERTLPPDFRDCNLTGALVDAWGRSTTSGFAMLTHNDQIQIELPAHTILLITADRA